MQNDLGLSENEAGVYLSALSLGPTTMLKISRCAEIKRSTVYSTIESLKQKGLMSVEIRGLKNVYVAQSPEKLEVLLENRKREFRNMLPEFLSLYNLKETESTIKYYEGMNALQDIYYDTLKEIKPREDYLVITNQEKWYNLDPKFSQDYIEKRAKLPINTRLLFQDSAIAREHKNFEKNFNEKIKILPEGTMLDVDTIILPHKIIITQTRAPITILTIENQSIVNMQKTMFEIIWKSLGE